MKVTCSNCGKLFEYSGFPYTPRFCCLECREEFQKDVVGDKEAS